MSRLLISPRHLQAVELHGASAYPEECCGVLIGRPIPDGERGHLVELVLAARNERRDSRANRYVIAPETVLSAHKTARAKGLEIVGYYHSHPDHPAEPSEFDREHAWPRVTYLIVSVEDGEAVAVRSWRLTDDRERFVEEKLEPAGSGRPVAYRTAEEAQG